MKNPTKPAAHIIGAHEVRAGEAPSAESWWTDAFNELNARITPQAQSVHLEGLARFLRRMESASRNGLPWQKSMARVLTAVAIGRVNAAYGGGMLKPADLRVILGTDPLPAVAVPTSASLDLGS